MGTVPQTASCQLPQGWFTESRILVLEADRGESTGQVGVFLDARDTPLTRRHDRGVAADEVVAPRLERTVVRGIRLDAGKAHADDDALTDADAAVDGDVVGLRNA